MQESSIRCSKFICSNISDSSCALWTLLSPCM
jgi:hypothetical protein